MRNKKIIEKENDKKTIKINIAMSILLVVVLSFISIGYALYGQVLNTRGTVTVNTQGKIAITDVTLTSSKNVKDGSIPAFTDDSIDFNLSFEKDPDSTEENYQAVYSITISNGTFYDYDFNLNNFQPVIKNSSGIEVDPSYLTYTLGGIALGDKIKAGETITFTLTLDFNPEEDDTYTVDGNMDTNLEEQPHGSILGSITGDTDGDLRESLNKNLVEVNISVINSYQSARTFTFNITDTSHFELVDANNNPLTNYTIDGGTTEQYTIYIKRAENAKYLTDSITTNIILSSSDSTNHNCGSIRILVDEEEEDDLTPPEISNIIVTTNSATSETTTDNKVGSITLNWTGSDNESGVEKYYIIAYKGASGSETIYNTYETENSNPEITIEGLEDANYSFKIYGSNNQHYSPSQSEIDSCNNNYCSKTTNTSYKWHFTVNLTSDSTNVKSISPTAVNRGKTLNATITANEGESGGCTGGNTSYSLSNTVTVKMGGSEITSGTTSGHYKYTLSSDKATATLNVYDVTGDITVKATASTS